MASSGSTDFVSTTQHIIKDALAHLNVLGTDEDVSAENYTVINRVLNRMIKTWQTQGYHLWKKTTGVLFLQQDKSEYEIYSTSSDHHTLSYVETTISADEAIGQTTISVTSSSGMTVGDYIGIEDDDGALEWSTIANIPDSTSVLINDALTVAASEDNKVYAYTTKLDAPFNIYSAVREDESEIDLPMNYLSYQDYFELPNKTSSSSPVSYSYDRQRDKAVIRIWPVPSNVDYLMKITFSKKIEDFDIVTNTADFPQEWEEAIVMNLALRLAPIFGRSGSPDIQTIKMLADESLLAAMSFDNEAGSLFLQIDNSANWR